MLVKFPGPSVDGIARTRKTDHPLVGLLVPGEVRAIADADARDLVACGLLELVKSAKPARRGAEETEGEEQVPSRRRKGKE